MGKEERVRERKSHERVQKGREERIGGILGRKLQQGSVSVSLNAVLHTKHKFF